MFGQFFAQTFYLKPVFLETQSEFASSQTNEYTDIVVQGNDAYMVKPLKFMPFWKNFSFSIGLYAGYVTKNKRNKFEFGHIRDGSAQGYVLYSTGWNPLSETKYQTSSGAMGFGVLFSKFSFNHFYNLSEKHNFWLQYGLSFGYRTRDFGLKHAEVYQHQLSANSYLVDSFNNYWEYENKYLFFNLGITKEFFFKEKYLFDLGIYHSQRIYTDRFSSFVSSMTLYVSVYENNQLIDRTSYDFWSRGTSLCLNIARKFQVYPWKRRTNDKSTSSLF